MPQWDGCIGGSVAQRNSSIPKSTPYWILSFEELSPKTQWEDSSHLSCIHLCHLLFFPLFSHKHGQWLCTLLPAASWTQDSVTVLEDCIASTEANISERSPPAAWSPRPACQILAMWSNWIGRIRDFFLFFFSLTHRWKRAAPAPSWTFYVFFFFLKWHGLSQLFALLCIWSVPKAEHFIVSSSNPRRKVYRFERANRAESGDLTGGRSGKDNSQHREPTTFFFFRIPETSQEVIHWFLIFFWTHSTSSVEKESSVQ